MIQLLLAVGLFVFFISVYGAVMVGGHLLEELERPEANSASATVGDRVGPRVAAASIETEFATGSGSKPNGMMVP